MRPLGLLAAVLLVSPGAPAQPPTARFADVAEPPPAPEPPRAASLRLPGVSWATAAARERVRRARAHEERGRAALAMVEYAEAIRLDSTFAPALIGMGRLREAQGDGLEAERLYTRASRMPGYAAEALTHRAKLARRSGRTEQAMQDLRAAVDLEPAHAERARQLARWYVEAERWPAALAVWRRLLTHFESLDAADEVREASVQVQALSLLAGSTDPVAAGGNDWVRHSLAAIARRRGR